jgi:GNAT superfamily N-acetyltransferase
MTIGIRRAAVTDAHAASEVARAAKAHWGYPRALLDAWEATLRITADYIARHDVFVATSGGRVVGVCAIETHGTRQELGHCWVAPDAQGRGVGSALLTQASVACLRAGSTLRIESDPHAAGFYERFGAIRVDDVPAPIPGNASRVLPVYELRWRAEPQPSGDGALIRPQCAFRA